MTSDRATAEQLAAEARRWADGNVDPKDWKDSPEAVINQAASKPISLRMPLRMLAIIKEFARREGVGYQVLIKRWLDDRIRQEALTRHVVGTPDKTAPTTASAPLPLRPEVLYPAFLAAFESIVTQVACQETESLEETIRKVVDEELDARRMTRR